MNNFTRSSGKAYWHSITNLTCCFSKLTGNLKLSAMGSMLVMLFLFSVGSVNAQSDQRSTDLNLCYDQIPEALSVESVAALFADACQGVEAEVTLSELVSGDDCSWTAQYTYDIKCGEFEDQLKIVYTGGDQSAPELEGDLPQDASGINDCMSAAPEGPSENAIAGLFTDNCGNVNVTKSGTPTGDDCDWSVTYTYMIVDDCGNYADNVVVTYSGGDQTPPELDKGAELPTGETGVNACLADRPEGPSEEDIAALFVDNCGDVLVTKSAAFKGDDCGWKGMITYVVSDSCGNTLDNIILDYSGGDTEDPVLDDFPTDFTVSCIDEIPTAQSINFTDNCTDGKNKADISDDTSNLGIACEGGTVIRTWTATDDCGNSSSHSITITVLPADPAEFETPEDYAIDCGDLATFEPQYLAYTNNGQGECEISGEVQGVADAFEGSCGSFQVNYSFTDECGRTITASQTVTVEDNTAPVIDPTAKDSLVECDGSGNQEEFQAWLDSNAGASATDNCGNVTWSYEIVVEEEGCGATMHYEVTFTASDDCGNSDSTKGQFTIEDTTDPSIDTEAADMTVECDGEGNVDALEAWLASNGGASASDMCSDVVWSNNYEALSDDCGATGSATVEFTATDDCGNDSKTTATFTIEDTNSPPITNEAQDMTVECDGEGNAEALAAWLANNGGAVASDICSEVTWSNDYGQLSDECGATGSVTVMFTVTDDCGLSSSTSATFTIEDTTKPSIDSEAEDMTVECKELNDDNHQSDPSISDWLNNNGGASASDACGDVTWSNDFTGLSDDCGNTGSATVTFTATDECGNESTTTATYTIEDTTPPSIDVEAADMTVECDGAGNAAELAAWLANNGGAVASDICGGVVWSNNYEALSDDCGATGSATVEFTATDDCGNESKSTATFTIEDTTNPTIDVEAADMTVECDGEGNQAQLEAWLANNGGASASDLCGDVTWSNNCGNGSGGNAENGFAMECILNQSTFGTMTYTPNGTDENGNTVFAGVFSVGPTSGYALVFNVETNRWEGGALNGSTLWYADTLSCNTADWTDTDVSVCETVNVVCGGEGSSVCELSEECGATGSVTVEFTATDSCGNTSKTTATFTVEDTVPPTMDATAKDLTVECDGEGNQEEFQAWLDANAEASASDDCSDVTWSYEIVVEEEGCGATMHYEVTFTATDDCGNSTETKGQFTIEDTTDPSIDTEAADMTVECDGAGNQDALDAWLAANGGASASDMCSDVVWSNNFSGLSDDCGATGSATVDFTATDDCGNESKTTATFTIEDTTNPSIDNAAEDMIVECDGAGNAAELAAWLADNGGAEASDMCSDVTWSNDYVELSDDCGATGSATVVFTAADDCGNTSKTEATFTIEDTTDPSIDTEAADMTVECDGEGNQADLDAWLANNGGAMASDLCGDVTWSYSCGSSNGGGIVFDCVLNDTVYGQTIFEAPIGYDDNGYAIYDLGDGDYPNSGGYLEDYFSMSFNSSENRWEVFQQGGLIWTSDVASSTPSCNMSDWAIAGPNVICEIIDVHCGEGEGSSVCELSDECGATGSVTVDFTATDSCGNTSKTTATFTVEDTTNPTIDADAKDLTVECDGEGNVEALEAWLEGNAEALASDACGDVTWSNNYEALSDDCGATGSATVEFTATDSCGNESKTSATFTIEDTTNPTIDTEASDMTVECGPGGDSCSYAFQGFDSFGDGWNGAVMNISVNGDLVLEYTLDGGTAGDVAMIPVSNGDTITLEYASTGGFPGELSYVLNDSDGVEAASGDDVGTEVTAVCAVTEGSDDAFAAWLANNGGAEASDLCGDVTWSNNSQGLSDDCGATGTETVEFTATDSCGNTSKTSATFTIEDTTPPSIDADANDMTVECDGNGNAEELAEWLASNGGASSSDLCSEVVWSNDFEALSDDCGATGSATVTFTATDDCGNMSTTEATFTIEDTTNPSIDQDAMDMEVECNGAGNQEELAAWLANNGGATASDICSGVVWSNDYTMLSDDCGETGSALVTFTATDDCGNESTTSATFTIVDTVDPNVTPAMDMTVECDGEGNAADLAAWFANNGGATASDDCSDVTWSYNCGEPILLDSGSATGTNSEDTDIPDDDDNGISTTANVSGIPAGATIEDITVDLSIEHTWVGDLGITLTAPSGESLTLLSFPGTPDPDNSGAGDSSNASAAVEGTITFTDAATVLGEDMGATIGGGDVICLDDGICDYIPATGATVFANLVGQMIANGANPNGDWSLNVVDQNAGDEGFFSWAVNIDWALYEVPSCELSDECGATGSVTATFTATDDCGNSTSTTATFTVEDTTPPTIDAGAKDLTVECDGEGNLADLEAWLESNAEAVASDECSSVTWSNSCSGESNGGRTFECVINGDSYIAVLGGSIGTDEFGYELFAPGTIEQFPDNTYPVLYNHDLGRWELREAFPQGGSNLFMFSISDSLSPSCDTQDWIDAGPFCQLISIGCGEGSSVCELSDECGATGSVTVTFTATDECGNSSDTQATFTIEDTTDPTIDVNPMDMTVECDGAGNLDKLNAWLDNFAGAEGSDECGETAWSHNFSGLSDDCGETGSATVTFTLTDACGNTSEADATFTIEDTTNPTIDTEAKDATVECDGEGNVAELQAWLDSNGGAAASDTCSGVTWSNDFEELSDDCGETGSATVTFTATDDCGNMSSTTATFTIEDTIAPILVGTVPPSESDINACADAMPIPPTEEEIAALFSDDCSDIVVSLFTSPVGDDCGWSVIHIYTVSDECGNDYGDVKVYYSGSDQGKPSIDGVPADVTVECDAIPGKPEVTVTDNCDDNIEAEYLEVRTDGDCPNNYTLTRSWTATDECGNSTTETQVITVQDTTAPVLEGELPTGENQIDMCQPSEEDDFGPSAEEVAALYADNCGDVVVTKVINNNGDDCKWIIDIEYTVTDDCGNFADQFKIWFHGGDFSAPVLAEACENETMTLYTSNGADCPADAGFSLSVGDTVGANEDWAVAGIYISEMNSSLEPCFTDNCSAKEDLTFEVMEINDSADGCPKTMSITFDVIDNCMNRYEGFVCTFIIIDDEAPVLDCPDGSDLGLNPDMDANGIPYGLVDKVPYTDNCDADGMTFDYTDSEITSEPITVEGCLYTVQGFDSFGDGWNGGSLDVLVNGEVVISGYDISGSSGAITSFIVNDGDIISTDFTEGDFVSEVSYVINNSSDTEVANVADATVDVADLVVDCEGNEDSFETGNSNFTLVRTFTQTDACGNTGDCSVTYTWTAQTPCDLDYPVIACNDVINGNTDDGEVHDAVCTTTLNTAPGKWHTIVGTGETMTISTCSANTTYDTKMGIFTGDCADECITGNDDADCEHSSLHSSSTFDTVEGQEYHVYVTGFDTNTGDYELSVTCGEPLPPAAPRTAQVSNDIELDFKAYPVPFDREVTISFDFEFDTDVTINVHDTRGLLVKTEIMNNVRANARRSTKLDLSRGGDQIFYVTVTTNRGSVTKKIVSSGMKR